MKTSKILILLSMLILVVIFVQGAVWIYSPGGSDPSLVGYWKFDGNALDSSSNGNNGTVTGAVVTNKGKFGRAYEFDGLNDYIKRTVADWNDVETGTISAWIKPAQIGINNFIFGTADEATAENQFQIRITTGNNLRVYIDPGADYATGDSSLVADIWYHVTVTSDGSNWAIYVNGDAETLTVVGTDGPWFADVPNRDNFVIGGLDFGGTDGYFNGTIDEVMIFNRSLSAAEIRELYNESLVSHSLVLKGSGDNGLVNNTGIVGWWDFNGNALDKSGEGNNGTVTGATKTNKGKYKGAYEFDGVDDKITVQSSSSIGFAEDSSFSISYWIYPYTINNAGYNYILGKAQYGVWINYAMRTYLGNLQMVSHAGGSNCWGTTITPNQWYHIVGVWGDGWALCYVNGVEGINTTKYNYGETVVKPLYFGDIASSPGASDGFNGTIDEVMIFNRSLSASEIRELYNESLVSHSTVVYGSSSETSINNSYNLVSHWRLDGDATDSKGSNDGTVTGATYTNKGKFKQAYEFDGVDDYISVASSNTLKPENEITISCWIKLNSYLQTTNYNGWFSSCIYKTSGAMGNNVRAYAMVVENATGVPLFGVDDNNVANYEINGPALNLHRWYLLLGTYNGSLMSLYIDGSLVNTTTRTGVIDHSNYPLYIGNSPNEYGIPDWYSYINAAIDEVRIYNRSLSASEIRQLYNESKNSFSDIVYGSGDQN